MFTTVGSADKAELSRRAGADHVIVYTEVDFRERGRGIGRSSLSTWCDGVGADTFMKGLDLLRPRGMMVTFGNASGPVPEINAPSALPKGSPDTAVDGALSQQPKSCCHAAGMSSPGSNR